MQDRSKTITKLKENHLSDRLWKNGLCNFYFTKAQHKFKLLTFVSRIRGPEKNSNSKSPEKLFNFMHYKCIMTFISCLVFLFSDHGKSRDDRRRSRSRDREKRRSNRGEEDDRYYFHLFSLNIFVILVDSSSESVDGIW